jgi:hypothetical protein
MKKFTIFFLALLLSAGLFAAEKPIIFGSLIGNFSSVDDPQLLGWIKPDGVLDEKVCGEDLRLLANAGADATRLFKPRFELLVSPGMYDVSRFDQVQFDNTKKAITLSLKWGIKPWLTLWFNHAEPTPWKNNIQGLKDPYSSISLSEAYIERVVAELGTDIGYEIICEPYYKGSGTSASFMNPGSSSYWLAKMIQKLWALGVPAENIIYGPELVYTWDKTAMAFKINTTRDMVGQAAEVVRVDLKKKGWTLKQINDNLNAGWQTQHGCGVAPETIDGVYYPIGQNNQLCVDIWGKATSLRRVMLSDDGSRVKPEPGKLWPRPTEEQEYLAARGTLKEPFPKGVALEVLGYKLNGQVYANLRAVSRAVFEECGSWPDNWNRFASTDPSPPVPNPEPEPTPGPDPEAAKVGVLAVLLALLGAAWKRLVAYYRKHGAWWWWLILFASIGLLVVLLF